MFHHDEDQRHRHHDLQALLGPLQVRADMILVVEQGEIVERGRHRELMERQGGTTSSTRSWPGSSCFLGWTAAPRIVTTTIEREPLNCRGILSG